jgi:type II secretory pathway component PulK
MRQVNGRNASVLVLALWSVCLLSAFTVILGYEVRQRVTVAYRIDERQKLAHFCDAAVKRAIAELKSEPEKSYDALNDPWSLNPDIFKEIRFSDGVASVVYEVAGQDNSSSGLWYGIQDEGRKININKADLSILKHLFTNVLGYDEIEAQDLAGAIVDWRDADSEPAQPGSSAETMYYHGLAHPYEAKNAPFERIEELMLVQGVDARVYDRIKDFLTLYGDGKININTASPEVLLAAGVPKDVVESILSIRRGHDGIEGTPDDGIFEDPSGIVAKISQHSSLTPEELSGLSQVVGDSLVTASLYYTVHSKAQLLNKKINGHLWCVVDRAGKVYACGE